MTPHVLSFKNVDFSYGDAAVLSKVSLTLPKQNITALMGPSGSGKSTLLALAIGLLEPNSGDISRFFSRSAIMFQDPLLLPWRSALNNVAFALKADQMPKADRMERAREMLLSVSLKPDVFSQYPHQLSGGMRQRVALARALVGQPDFLVLDEPFGALDKTLADQMRELVMTIAQAQKMSVLFVTHNEAEASDFADQIIQLP